MKRALLSGYLLLASGLLHALPSDSDAARATQFDGLHLLGARDQESRLTRLDIALAYVDNDTRPAAGQYVCGGLSRSDAASAGGEVADALLHLPALALSRLGLKYVVLCAYATAGGQNIGGIPVPSLNLLMLDAGGDSAALAHRTLHELYHLLEYRDGSFGDAGWSSQFGGYSNNYPATLRRSPVGSGRPGFINAYAETHPHEERAELFAYLMLSPGEVGAQARRDAVLRKKAEYLADKCERLGVPVNLPR